MILLVDNYDSFVHNLARYVRELGYDAEVLRNDALTATQALALDPTAVILSPGPCTPNTAGISLDLIARADGRVPILGVCLGHQCIGQAYGGKVVHARRPVHGKQSQIEHLGSGLFRALPNPLTVARYHSLMVSDLPPDDIEITARSADGEVMALRHRRHPVFGLQFHPESVLATHGHQLLANFLAVQEATDR